jgi:hypothetical protein
LVDGVDLGVGEGVDLENNRTFKGGEPATSKVSRSLRFGHLSIVKFLVESGADVNKSAREGWFLSSELRTPLRMAKKYGHDEVVEYLLERGAERE